MKKFLARVLILALLLSTADFSAITAEAATDGYTAYDKLISHRNVLVTSNLLAGVCNMLQPATSATRNDLTDEGYPYESWTSGSGSTSTDGLYHIKLSSEAYAQIKSGQFTGESNYDAMSGTPTTEDLFLNAGGTPWLVDVTYRIVRAKYARNYNFKVNDTANYRYYRVGTTQSATVCAPFEFTSEAFKMISTKDPRPYMVEYHQGSASEVFYSPSWDALQRGITVNTSNDTYTDSYNTLVSGMPKDLNRTGVGPQQNWYNISMNYNHDQPASMYGPGYQMAAIFKWMIGYSHKSLQERWDGQDDNYRADAGYDRKLFIQFDSNKDGINDSGEYRYYDASWEYTYGWMARHTSSPGGQWQSAGSYPVPSIVNGAHNANESVEIPNNNSVLNCTDPGCILKHHKSVWNPLWISVHCDDSMVDTVADGEIDRSILTHSSSAVACVPTFKTCGIASASALSPADYMRSLYCNANGTYTSGSDVFGVRDVWQASNMMTCSEIDGHQLFVRAASGLMYTNVMSGVTPAITEINLQNAHPDPTDPAFVQDALYRITSNNTPYALSLYSISGTVDFSNYYTLTRQLLSWAFGDANNADNRDSLFEALSDVNSWKDYYNRYYTYYMKSFTENMPAPNVANWPVYQVQGSNSSADSALRHTHYTKKSIDALKAAGWKEGNGIAVEGPILFYSRAYGWMNLVAPFLYYDEFKTIFGDFPGIQLSDSWKTEWDKAAACNLSLIFGSPNGVDLADKPGQTVFHRTAGFAPSITLALPLACFPAGGDMDGTMNTSWSSYSPEVPLSPGQQSDYVHPAEDMIYNPALCPYNVFWIQGSYLGLPSSSYKVERLEVTEEKYITKYAHTAGHCGDASATCECAVSSAYAISSTVTLDSNHVCTANGAVETKDAVCNTVSSHATDCPASILAGASCSATCTYGDCNGSHTKQYANSDVHYMGVNDHSDVSYKTEYRLTYAVMNGMYSGETAGSETAHSWILDVKSMTAQLGMQQIFENVEYVDIVSATIWQWSQAEVKGLSGLLARPLSTDSANHGNIRNYGEYGDTPTLVTNAIRSLGFDVYNVDDSKLKGSYSIVNENGTFYTVYSDLQYDLEVRGRVANSYNPMSASNDFNNWEVLYTAGSSGGMVGSDYTVYGTHYSKLMRRESTIRTSDSPIIQNAQRGVNNDDHAFSVLHTEGYGYWNLTASDDLYFYYDPYSQGGTSSSNFWGFVNQGIARTLSYRDLDGCGEGTSRLTNDGDNKNHAHPYSNSILIQGDYIVLRLPNGEKLPLVGSYYDTWVEHDESGSVYSDSMLGGKFSLMKGYFSGNSFQNLLPYNSMVHPWVPGDVNYILSRSYNASRAISLVDGTDFTQNSWVHNYSFGINSNVGTVCDLNLYGWSKSVLGSMYTLSAYNASYGLSAVNYDSGSDNVNANDIIYNKQVPYGIEHTMYTVNSGSNYPSVPNPMSLGGTYRISSLIDGNPKYFKTTIPYDSSKATSDLESISVNSTHVVTYSESHDAFYVSTIGAEYAMQYTGPSALWPSMLPMILSHAVNLSGTAVAGSGHDPTYYTDRYTRHTVTLKQGNVKHGMNTSNVFTNENLIQNPVIGFQEGYSSTKPISFVPGENYQKGLTWSRNGILFDDDHTFIVDIMAHWRELSTDAGSGYKGHDPAYKDIKTFTKFGVLMHSGEGIARQAAINSAYRRSIITVPSGEILINPNRNVSSDLATNVVDRQGTAYRNDITNWTDIKPSQWYPWLSDLNVKRFLGNQTWDTGQVGIRYNLAYNKQDGSILEDGADADFASWTEWNPAVVNGHIVEAKYTALGSQHVNDIVIYNPLTTESAIIKKLSEYLPDGANFGNTPSESFGGGLYGTSYAKFFGSSVIWAVIRDQRTARVALSDASHPETITNGTIRFTSATQSTSRFEWYMRAVSLAVTRAYTWSDYHVVEEEKEVKIIDRLDTENHETRITKTGMYRLVTVDNQNQIISTTVSLKSGDVVYWSDTGTEVWVQSGANVVEQKFDTFVKAANSLLPEDAEYKYVFESEYVEFPAGSTVNLLAATIDMIKGSYITLTLDLYDEKGDPLPWDILSYWHYDHSAFEVYEQIDGATHTLHIEALQDTTLNGLMLENLIQAVRVGHFEGSSLEAKDILLISIGNDNQPVTQTTTITYLYGKESWSQSSLTRTSSYNKTVVEISGEWHIEGVESYEARYCYLQTLQNYFTIELKDDAYGPHNVPNTLWKYYVLGWSTVDHTAILDINDERLNEGSSTILVTPSGMQVAVSDMYKYVNEGRLYVANVDGTYRLVIRNSSETSALPTVFEWYGIEMGIEDARSLIRTVHFGENCSWYGNTISVAVTDRADVVTHYFYEVFRATKVEGIAYEVKYSMNLQHKYAVGVLQSLYELDWEEREIKVIIGESVDAYGNVNSTYAVSLDDEFSIYWDNYGDLYHGDPDYMVTQDGYASIQSKPGRGYDNIFLTSDVTQYSGHYNKYITDTTTWIRNKYLTFNIDVYAFTESIPGGGNFIDLSTVPYDQYNPANCAWFNPTTPAYKGDGTPNKVVYIPAGTRVYLGEYDNGGIHGYQQDNLGRFHDFGDNATKDPNGEKYVYHFWLPLGVGELDEEANVQMHVMGINGSAYINGGGYDSDDSDWTISRMNAVTGMGGNNQYQYLACPTIFGLQKYVDSKSKNEWDELVVVAGGYRHVSNVDAMRAWCLERDPNAECYERVTAETQESTLRDENSENNITFSVYGRIGGITVVDTTDPAYSDSFKMVDEIPTEWYVTQFIRKINHYSSSTLTNLIDSGHQYVYKSDVTDVRGRAVAVANYMNYQKQNFNTYGTQFHKRYTWSAESQLVWKYVHQKIRFGMSTWSQQLFVRGDIPDLQTYTPRVSPIGTEVFCSLETIGNYFGSVNKRINPESSEYVNGNGDYGQTKVQVQILYTDADGNPLDIYLKQNGKYYLINAGSAFVSKDDAQAFANETGGIFDAGPYISDAVYNAYTETTIYTNSDENWYTKTDAGLDQHMQRLYVTEEESYKTRYVMKYVRSLASSSKWTKRISSTILESFGYTASEIGASFMEYIYSYGTSEMLFMREYNRTFVGGGTSALNYWDAESDIAKTFAPMYGQKWYFSIQLPTNIVIVPHGTKITGYYESSYQYEVVISWIKAFALGDKWIIRYESESQDFNDDPEDDSGELKIKLPQPETDPTPIPVYVFKPDKNASFTDRGTY